MSQPAQQQQPPGHTGELDPYPDHGEESYRGSGRLAGKAAEVAPAYVMLASDEASYISGARIAVTGGKPIL